jgi:hypothetical protein
MRRVLQSSYLIRETFCTIATEKQAGGIARVRFVYGVVEMFYLCHWLRHRQVSATTATNRGAGGVD